MSLSGAWRGLRRIAGPGPDAVFHLTLIEAADRTLSGLLEEAAGGALAYAAVEGHHRDETVIFIASPEGGDRLRLPTQFVGAVFDGCSRIEGTWVLAGVGAGRFELERIAAGVGEAAGRDYSLA